jgi:hypothetical protein
MKKIISFLILVSVFYILAVFQFPEITDSFGTKKYNDMIRSFKGNLDTTVTDIPSVEEAKSAFSGAKSTFIDWVSTTKEKIDSIRETASGAEATYNKTVETITTVKKTVDGISDTLNDIDTLREGVMNSVNTQNVNTAISNK